MRSQRFLPIGLMLLGAALVAGCGQAIVEEYNFTQSQKALGYDPDPKAFDAELVLCRTVAKDSGRRIGEGDIFSVAEGNRVRAFLDVRNQPLEKIHAWHMVWLRPGDEKELFRKYAEVKIREAEEGYEAELVWKKAEDLNQFKTVVQKNAEPVFTLNTAYNVAPEKNRRLGRHGFRVYLNRELLFEKSFELIGCDVALSGPGDAAGENFVIPKKGKVDAAVALSGLEPGKTYRGKLTWHKPGGKKLFGKEIEFTAIEDSTAALAASLDIAKNKKRKPGKYQLKVYVNDCQVAREKFTLSKP